MQHQDGMAPKSVGDLNIDTWCVRYERNRNIVPAGLPRFFLGHVVALKNEIADLEYRLSQRTEALTEQLMRTQENSAANRDKPSPTIEKKKSTGSKTLKKDES